MNSASLFVAIRQSRIQELRATKQAALIATSRGVLRQDCRFRICLLGFESLPPVSIVNVFAATGRCRRNPIMFVKQLPAVSTEIGPREMVSVP